MRSRIKRLTLIEDTQWGLSLILISICSLVNFFLTKLENKKSLIQNLISMSWKSSRCLSFWSLLSKDPITLARIRTNIQTQEGLLWTSSRGSTTKMLLNQITTWISPRILTKKTFTSSMRAMGTFMREKLSQKETQILNTELANSLRRRETFLRVSGDTTRLRAFVKLDTTMETFTRASLAMESKMESVLS